MRYAKCHIPTNEAYISAALLVCERTLRLRLHCKLILTKICSDEQLKFIENKCRTLKIFNGRIAKYVLLVMNSSYRPDSHGKSTRQRYCIRLRYITRSRSTRFVRIRTYIRAFKRVWLSYDQREMPFYLSVELFVRLMKHFLRSICD